MVTFEDEPFRVDVARFEEHAIVGLSGRLDHASAPTLERGVLALLQPPIRGVVIDLAYCSGIDHAGADVLAGLYEKARDVGISCRLTSVPPTIATVLVASGLTELFDHPDGPNARRLARPSRLAP